MNKTQLSVFAVFVAIFSTVVTAEPLRLSEPVTVTAEHETFGEPLDPNQTIVKLSDVLARKEHFTKASFVVSAQVGQVCQKKGCFFIAHDGDLWVRVSFKDYGFFVPTNLQGAQVKLAGQLVRREVNAEQAAHFNSDLGSEGAIEPGFVYEIVATSVQVPLS